MLTRAVLVLPIMFCCASLLPAQRVEPTWARPLMLNPDFTPPGAVRVSDYTIIQITGGSYFMGITYQQSLTGPFTLRAFDYTGSNDTLTPRPDFDSLTLNTQEIAITPDLLTIAVFLPGVGPRILQRASLTSPWSGLLTIPGLPGSAYGLQFCRVRGVLSLLACISPPNAHLRLYDFDATTASVSNCRTLTPPLGSSSNFPAFAIPLRDANDNTRGFLVCIRQPIGFQQQFVFSGGVDPTSAWSVYFNTPLNSTFVGGDQLRGGHVVAANSGLPIGALPIGPIDVIGTFTFETIASTLGGGTDVTMMGPPDEIGIIGIAAGLGTPVAVPGFGNLFGLNPAAIFAIVAAPMPEGVGQVPFFLSPTTTGLYALQGASLSLTGSQNHFGNTEWLRVL